MAHFGDHIEAHNLQLAVPELRAPATRMLVPYGPNHSFILPTAAYMQVHVNLYIGRRKKISGLETMPSPPVFVPVEFHPYGYDAVKIIGTGHFGSVYLVKPLHDSTNMLVCKLVALDSLIAKDRRLAEQEVGILRALSHKNIVHFHEYFRISSTETLCLVMEYCEHGDLRHIIKEQKKSQQLFSERQVMTWFVQIVDGLRYIHANRVIHRDLKTSNIFLKGPPPYTCLIGDFGISRILEETLTAAQTVIGTPYYLSPEVCKKEPYSYKSDIWSLGACLYELLTFKMAFRSPNLFSLITKIINEPYEPIKAGNYSDSALALVEKLLTKDSAVRPSAADLMRDQYVRSFITERPPPPPVPAGPVLARSLRPRVPPQMVDMREEGVEFETAVEPNLITFSQLPS